MAHLANNYSKTIRTYWKVACISLLVQLSKTRNRSIYQEKCPAGFYVLLKVKMDIQNAYHFVKNTVYCQREIALLAALLVSNKAPPMIRNSVAVWKPPEMGWLKINADGSSFGAPWHSGTGFIVRNSYSGVIRVCVKVLGISLCEMLMEGLTLALETTAQAYWNWMWIKLDAASVVSSFNNRSWPWVVVHGIKLAEDFGREGVSHIP